MQTLVDFSMHTEARAGALAAHVASLSLCGSATALVAVSGHRFFPSNPPSQREASCSKHCVCSSLHLQSLQKCPIHFMNEGINEFMKWVRGAFIDLKTLSY